MLKHDNMHLGLQMSYLHQNLAGKRLITAMTLCEPSPSCVVCGTSQLQLTIHTGTTTLGTFIDKACHCPSPFLLLLTRDF